MCRSRLQALGVAILLCQHSYHAVVTMLTQYGGQGFAAAAAWCVFAAFAGNDTNDITACKGMIG